VIAVVDYGSGNIGAFVTVYGRLNVPLKIARRREDLDDATKIILPGVGAFDYAMGRLERSGIRPALEEAVRVRHVPVLGVCVGMQMLGASSEEGRLPGLGWIDGDVRRFAPPTSSHAICVPHMGWNTVTGTRASGLMHGLEHDARFYFLHSYFFHCNRSEDVVAVTTHDVEFACTVNSGTVYGVQFHPEKSHQWGVRLLENFARL